MTIKPVILEMRCEHQFGNGFRCARNLTACELLGPSGLLAIAKQQGWQHKVLSDGRESNRNGKDYCPEHPRPQ